MRKAGKCRDKGNSAHILVRVLHKHPRGVGANEVVGVLTQHHAVVARDLHPPITPANASSATPTMLNAIDQLS